MTKEIKLNNKIITKEKGKELFVKYIKSKMEAESFLAGIAIQTPEGTLQAEVEF